MGNYAVGHSFNLSDLFINFNIKRLQMSPELCKKIYSDGSKRDLAASIFLKSVQMVVNDIIENNVHFKMPSLGRSEGYLYMDKTTGDDFKRLFKKGKWNDVDFLESNFTGYQLAVEITSPHKPNKHKKVYLSASDRNRITEHTNNGKRY